MSLTQLQQRRFAGASSRAAVRERAWRGDLTSGPARRQAKPALRREQIKFQVALITPLIHVKGYAAPETKAAVEKARLLIEKAEEAGESPDDRLLALVLGPLWLLGHELCGISWRCRLRSRGAVPSALGAVKGESPAHAWASPNGRFLDVYWRHRVRTSPSRSRGRALRPYGALSAGDTIRPRHRVGNLFNRSMALWLLGYAKAARIDTEHAPV